MSPSQGGHPLATAVWILLGAVVVAGAAGIAAGILSPVLILDLASLWPLVGVATLLGAWGRRRSTQPRGKALLPMALFTSLVLAAALHLGGWELLPSAEGRLTGPELSEVSDPTEIRVNVSGDLVLGANAGAAYRIEPILRGGSVGVPGATETYVNGDLSIWIEEIEAPDWYAFAGWRLTLNPEVAWKLILNGALDADLTELEIESAAIAGSGTILLGTPPPGGSGLIVAGPFTVTVPDGTAVIVNGPVVAPPDWVRDGDTTSSPHSGDRSDRWRIAVQGESPIVITVAG